MSNIPAAPICQAETKLGHSFFFLPSFRSSFPPPPPLQMGSKETKFLMLSAFHPHRAQGSLKKKIMFSEHFADNFVFYDVQPHLTKCGPPVVCLYTETDMCPTLRFALQNVVECHLWLPDFPTFRSACPYYKMS
jgi:hypothetical protein